MSQTAVATAEAPEPSTPKKIGLKPLAILIVGGLTLLAWIGFLAGGMLAVDEETTRLLSDVQLAFVVLSAGAALWSGRRLPAVVSVVAALVYTGVWFGLGKIHWSVSDAVYFALIAGFYLSVPVSAASTLIAGGKVLRAAR